MPLHLRQVMTMDWVPLRVEAVLFYRVTEPYLWVTQLLNGSLAIETLAQTTLRASLGTHTLSGILAQRKSIAHTMEVSRTLWSVCVFWGLL